MRIGLGIWCSSVVALPPPWSRPVFPALFRDRSSSSVERLSLSRVASLALQKRSRRIKLEMRSGRVCVWIEEEGHEDVGRGRDIDDWRVHVEEEVRSFHMGSVSSSSPSCFRLHFMFLSFLFMVSVCALFGYHKRR